MKKPQPANPADWPAEMNLNQEMYFARDIEPFVAHLEGRIEKLERILEAIKVKCCVEAINSLRRE